MVPAIVWSAERATLEVERYVDGRVAILAPWDMPTSVVLWRSIPLLSDQEHATLVQAFKPTP